MANNQQPIPESSLTDTRLTRQQKSALIIATLALHAGALLTLFFMKTDTQKFQQFFEQLVEQAALAQEQREEQARAQNLLPGQKPEEQEEWGAMKARASRFGAPVIFQEEPEFIAPEPAQQEQPMALADIKPEQPTPTQQKQAPEAKKIASQKDSGTEKKESPKLNDLTLFGTSSTQFVPVSPENKEADNTHENDATEKPQNIADQENGLTQKLTLAEQAPDTENAADTQEKDANQPDSPTSAQAADPQSQKKADPARDFGWGKKDAAPITKKMVSLANLARGFLDNIKNEGTSAITMIGGKEGGRITTEQLKMERYVQRLNWCLQNSFRINRTKYRETYAATTAEVYLVLDRAGHIKDVRILKSSGDPLLDDHTLFVFKDAGGSFPSVPQYLPQDPFVITYIVEYNLFNPPHSNSNFHFMS